ncbi:M56 family metallopeptidase [Mucilaginibacter sp.]|uniref:M56 family metallopeptidase n=1 Tax=Mucilaginibacter sp. TaxID=1882438 RepID=UPI0025F4BE2B|nr:M56 family metallopeptidase [Mucilaginibacter sp.]
MPALFVFLLKVNVALLLFCAGYYLVLRHLTFYTLNRFYLLTAILFASIYPRINLNDFVQQHQALARPVQRVVINWQAPAQALVKQVDNPNYWFYVEVIFWVGAAFLAVRLFIQLFSLYRLYKSSQPATIGNHHVRVMDQDIAPFSFWQSIFVNPANHEPTDLKAILLHEQVHVNQWHTADILLAEFSSIFYWFNPGIWLMKKAIRENIEFITDQKILKKGIDSKTYQYSLVSVSFNNTQPGIVNHFNLSTIKKRIIMMNAKRSSKINLTRYAFLVPAVVALLLVFSISKADFVKPIKITLANAVKPFANAIHVNIAKKADTLKLVSKPVKGDTSKTTFTVITDSYTSVYYINGEKGNAKNVDPNSITGTYVLDGKQAAQFVKDKYKENVQVVFITTKNSVAGQKLKEKLDSYLKVHPGVDVATATNFPDVDLKGDVQKVMVSDFKIVSDTLKDGAGKAKTVYYNYNVTPRVPGVSGKSITKVIIAGKNNQVIKSDIKINEVVTNSVTANTIEDDNDEGDIAKVVGTTAAVSRNVTITKRINANGTSTATVSGWSTSPAIKTIVVNGKSVNDTIMAATSPRVIYIRKTADSTKASPLILIDGKEASSKGMKELNPNDIDSVSVLKDDAAVKKYGDKAKQGVIMISLKKKK